MEEENLKYRTKVAFYWNMISQVATYGMQFVVGVVMARLLSPSDYGLTALPAVFLAVASVFINGSFGLALIRKPDCSEKDLSTAFYYSIAMGIFMYMVIFFSAPWIAAFYDAPILTDLVRITALTFLVAPINTPQSVILNRRIDFKTSARINIVTRLLAGVLGIAIAYLGYGVWALVISNLFATVSAAILTWIAVKWIPRERFSRESFHYLWNFGNKMMVSSLIGTLYNNITPVIVGKFFGPAELGIYNRAHGYAYLPHSEIAMNVQSMTYPVLGKIQDDEERLIKAYNRIIRTVCFVYFPIMILLIGLAHPLVILMLTDKWEACVPLLQILSLVAISGPYSVLNMNVLQVKGRSDLYLNVDVKKKVVALIIMCCTLPFGLIAYCWGTLLSQCFVLYINLSCVKKVIPMSVMDQVRELIPMLILSAVMCASIFAFNYLFTNDWVQLFGGGIIGVAVYAGGAYLFKFPEIQEVKYMLSKKK